MSNSDDSLYAVYYHFYDGGEPLVGVVSGEAAARAAALAMGSAKGEVRWEALRGISAQDPVAYLVVEGGVDDSNYDTGFDP